VAAALRLAALFTALLVMSAATAEEVSIDAAKGKLRGTLERPAGARPAVCALIIAGSGPTDRDGNQPGLTSDSLKQLALGLAAHGVCALRYDKRGVGASSDAAPVESELLFDDYVADAAAWLARLKRIGGAGRVAVVGHGQGALVALLAAKRETASAVVSIAGAGRPAAELIRDQLRGLSDETRRRGEDILGKLAVGRTAPEIPAELGALFRPSVQPYLISWLRYNPAEEMRTSRVPVLIVQGTADLQVPVAEARILAAENPLAALSLLTDMNHVLKRCLSAEDQRAAYTDPAMPIDARVVDAIAGFLLRTP